MALKNAIRLAAAWRKLEPSDERGPLSLLAPTFSGSSWSLRTAIDEVVAYGTLLSYDTLSIRIVSGSATNLANGKILYSSSPGPACGGNPGSKVWA